jgi:hypothetical protein
MRIVNELFLVNKGPLAGSQEITTIIQQIRDAIAKVTWASNTEFVINPTRLGNGVKPIKDEFIKSLVANGHRCEIKMAIVDGIGPGPIDVIIETTLGNFAVEWETGNISSSHRALNKIALGTLQKKLVGGILILPARSLAQFLTDRIGNYEEFLPYFPLYRSINMEAGIIGVIAIEHDATSPDSSLIPKGKDGNSKKDE